MRSAVVFLEPKGTILEVVRAAKARGYSVVALSSDPSVLKGVSEPYDTALSCIDRVIPVHGWTNEEKILHHCESIHAETPIAGVYAGLDPCAVMLARLRAIYGLPTSRAEDLAIVINKFALRKKLNAFGLSKIKNYRANEVASWTNWVPKGAAYFKPVYGFFSAYVRRCENMDELSTAVSVWRAGAQNEPKYVTDYLRKSEEFHLEDAFDGELLSVEAIATNGELKVLGLLSRILYSKDPVVEMGSCFPYPHPLSEKILALVKSAHKALGLTDGPTHTEVIVSKDGAVEIIDLNPRFVGADVLQSINHAYGIRIEEALLDYAVGKPVQIAINDAHYACLQYFLPPEIDVLENVNFPEDPEVRFATTFLKPGAGLTRARRQIDYLGCYLTVMPSFQGAIDRSRTLRSGVKVNGSFFGEY